MLRTSVAEAPHATARPTNLLVATLTLCHCRQHRNFLAPSIVALACLALAPWPRHLDRVLAMPFDPSTIVAGPHPACPLVARRRRAGFGRTWLVSRARSPPCEGASVSLAGTRS